MTKDELSRFEAKWTPEPTTGCWLWFGADSFGYGYMLCAGKTRRAHRISFEHFERPLVAGEVVCHRCDTPACVNPRHLFAGTATDNQQDCIRKGRNKNRRPPPSPKGVDQHLAKLNDDAVREIRRDYRPGQKVYKGCSPFSSLGLGKKYGVDANTILDIIRRRTWKHVQ